MQPDSSDLGTEYDHEYIVQNPIATICRKCKRKENINAPSLGNVRCFWCGSELQPVDPTAYRLRLDNLWRHVTNAPNPQLQLFQTN